MLKFSFSTKSVDQKSQLWRNQQYRTIAFDSSGTGLTDSIILFVISAVSDHVRMCKLGDKKIV